LVSSARGVLTSAAPTLGGLTSRLARLGTTVALATCLLAAGCGGSGEEAEAPTASQPPPSTAAQSASSAFDYDALQPLAIRDAGRVNENYPIAVRDVSYAIPGGRVQAYLAVPPAAGKRPAAVVVHGSGGDRSQLLLNALWLAGRGAVTLAITSPSSTSAAGSSQGLTPTRALRRQRDLAVRDAVAVRRGLDLLQRRADVDSQRFGYLGWSAGARTGAVLAGIEPRLEAIALMSGGAAPVDEYASRAPAALRPEVHRLLDQVDPLRLIAEAKPDTLLLQNGRQDTVVPRAALEALVAAAPTETDVRWYDAGHDLNLPAYRDQLAWLAERLKAGPAVKGARTGP
jgi:dienelactone hydrolase